MPGLDGISVARALAAQNPSPAVVFVTAFDQFAVAAFEVEAVDYLIKPVEPARLQRAPTGRAYLAQRRASLSPARVSQWLEEFWASDMSGLVRIAAQDVDRVSAERDYMRLHVGRRSWLIHHSMAALEEGLNPELFVRLHRSAIVRKDFITGFTRNQSGRWIARLGDGVDSRSAASIRTASGRSPAAELTRKQTAARLGRTRGGRNRHSMCGDDERRAVEHFDGPVARPGDGSLIGGVRRG